MVQSCTTEGLALLRGGYKMIESLEVKNFKCFKELKLSHLRRFNIIVGANASGKTSFLEALFIAAGVSPEIYLRARSWRGEGKFQVSASLDGVESLFRDGFHDFDTSLVIEFSFVDSNQGRRSLEVFLTPKEVETLPLEGQAHGPSVAREVCFRWNTPSGPHESVVQVEGDQLKMPRFSDPFLMTFLNNRTLMGSENSVRFSDIRRKKEEQFIIRAVASIFPHVEDLSLAVEAGNTTIHASVRGVSQTLPVGYVSSGINKYISVLLAISVRPSGTVLIDEVENGFYYSDVQRIWSSIAESCYEKDVQMFVTTHSREWIRSILPEIEKHTDDYCLLKTERANGFCSVKKFGGKDLRSALTQEVEFR